LTSGERKMLQADEYFFAPVLFRQGLQRQPGDAGCSDARLEAATRGSLLKAAGGTVTCKTAKAKSPVACQKIIGKNCNIFTGLKSD
jgi:hypothetical protein